VLHLVVEEEVADERVCLVSHFLLCHDDVEDILADGDTQPRTKVVFNTSEGPKGSSFCIYSKTWAYRLYIRPPNEIKIHRSPNFCKRYPKKIVDPKNIVENAIGTLSTGGVDKLDALAAHTVAGNDATWRQADIDYRDRAAKDPPLWHAC
jgi:hypothetical protein